VNEWQTIAWFAGIGGGFLTIAWKMVDVARTDLAGRIKKCEHVIDNMVSDCAKKKDDFITTKAFDRFEGHLVNRIETVQKSVDNLTRRLDDYISSTRNGKGVNHE
jgi:hypothetical protein